jgi:3-hydroxymyristoyl/3-hydroxydecanoyl-(acyl carrier protein) dehydratase
MWQSIEVHFARNHPTAAGHFPSNPIIPGVLLLDEVVKAVAGPAHSAGEITIRAAKFFRPVHPGESMQVRWQMLSDGAIKFECRLADDAGLAAAGTLAVGSTLS